MFSKFNRVFQANFACQNVRNLSNIPSANTQTEYQFDYQYLERSPVPSDKFQDSLPRLPIPPLKDTLERYLDSQRPLLTTRQLKVTERIVRDFQDGDGERLDAELRDRDLANINTSYVSEPWMDFYLKDRRPLAFHQNAGLAVIQDGSCDTRDKLAARITSILISTLRYFRSLNENLLRPSVFHMEPSKTDNEKYWNDQILNISTASESARLFQAYPLDMSQHKFIFQTSRIPTPERDVIQRFPDSKHICIMRNGHIFSLNVFDNDGNIHPPQYYFNAIREIIQGEPSGEPQGVSVLTTEDRDTWTDIRQHLMSLGDNRSVLNMVESAITHICLDEHWNFEERDMLSEETVEQVVYGHDPTNRWYDKSYSLILSRNGALGVHLEHSWGDSPPWMSFNLNLRQDFAKNTEKLDMNVGTGGEACQVDKLEFKLDPTVKQAIEVARGKFEAKRKTVNFSGYVCNEIGKADCKRNGVRADMVMQTAIQAAHHRVSGTFLPTYESCSTATFLHGRTETVRSLTCESRAFVEAFNTASNQKQLLDRRNELFRLLNEASSKHKKLTGLASNGHGWDRHLFALENLSRSKNCQNVPEMFQDEAYVKINQILMSTSTARVPRLAHVGFCPVHPDGYGVTYMGGDDYFACYISSYGEKCFELKDAMEDTMDDFTKLLKK